VSGTVIPFRALQCPGRLGAGWDTRRSENAAANFSSVSARRGRNAVRPSPSPPACVEKRGTGTSRRRDFVEDCGASLGASPPFFIAIAASRPLEAGRDVPWPSPSPPAPPAALPGGEGRGDAMSGHVVVTGERGHEFAPKRAFGARMREALGQKGFTSARKWSRCAEIWSFCASRRDVCAQLADRRKSRSQRALGLFPLSRERAALRVESGKLRPPRFP
jgi:hypothetical protein